MGLPLCAPGIVPDFPWLSPLSLSGPCCCHGRGRQLWCPCGQRRAGEAEDRSVSAGESQKSLPVGTCLTPFFEIGCLCCLPSCLQKATQKLVADELLAQDWAVGGGSGGGWDCLKSGGITGLFGSAEALEQAAIRLHADHFPSAELADVNKALKECAMHLPFLPGLQSPNVCLFTPLLCLHAVATKPSKSS